METYTYTYDAAGNRATETVTDGSDTTVTTYTYNEQNRLLNTSAVLNQDPAVVVVYVYDNNGNLLNKGPDGGSPIAVYSYDGWNQMVSATEGATTVTMAYNGLGLRVEKTTGGATSRYLYEYSDVILETDGSNNQTGRNVYGANLVKRVAGGQSLFFFYNGHGDVTALISASSGDVVAGYYYDAFGNVVEKSGVVDNPYLYAGYRYDEELSLYYLLARFYDATIARFMQEDTYGGRISDPLSLNRYTYCLNNPLIYWDPTGHIVTPWDVVHGDSQAIAQIEEATNEYNEAAAAGDTEGMAVAHEKAVEARERFLDEASGEYVASDGTVYNRYGTDGNTSSVKALASYNGTLKINRIDLLKNWYVTNVYVKTTKIGAKMVDGVVYADAKQLAAELGYTISPPNPDGTITISSGSYSYTTQPGDSYVPLREVVTGGGYGDTISWWRDEDGFNVLVQPDLKNKAVQVTRAGDNITIKAYLNFEGAANEIFPGTIYTYAEVIYKGIDENWNNLSFVGTSYDFGIGKIITVKTELYSYYDSPSGVMMAPSTYNADQQYLTIRVDNSDPAIFVNYNTFDGTYAETHRCHVSRSGDWSISNLGTITMYPHYVKAGASIGSMTIYGYGEYKQVAAHEFGHILGLNDAYGEGIRPKAEATVEVRGGTMWQGDMMRNDGSVSANDVEMVWEAWSTNRYQYFQDYDGHTRSSAIRIIRIK